MISYSRAADIDDKVKAIAAGIGLEHDFSRVICVGSYGSESRRTIARCHALPRIMQMALGIEPHYVIDVLSERFDKLSEEEQVKTLIHELMHIPKAFGGGFRHHDHVNRRNVEAIYRRCRAKK